MSPEILRIDGPKGYVVILNNCDISALWSKIQSCVLFLDGSRMQTGISSIEDLAPCLFTKILLPVVFLWMRSDGMVKRSCSVFPNLLRTALPSNFLITSTRDMVPS